MNPGKLGNIPSHRFEEILRKLVAEGRAEIKFASDGTRLIRMTDKGVELYDARHKKTQT